MRASVSNVAELGGPRFHEPAFAQMPTGSLHSLPQNAPKDILAMGQQYASTHSQMKSDRC